MHLIIHRRDAFYAALKSFYYTLYGRYFSTYRLASFGCQSKYSATIIDFACHTSCETVALRRAIRRHTVTCHHATLRISQRCIAWRTNTDSPAITITATTSASPRRCEGSTPIDRRSHHSRSRPIPDHHRRS